MRTLGRFIVVDLQLLELAVIVAYYYYSNRQDDSGSHFNSLDTANDTNFNFDNFGSGRLAQKVLIERPGVSPVAYWTGNIVVAYLFPCLKLDEGFQYLARYE